MLLDLVSFSSDLEKVLAYLPHIDELKLEEIIHVMTQSRLFQNQFNDSKSDGLFELSYASYLGGANPTFLAIYKEIVWQACFQEFLEWYEYLTKNILSPDVQAALGFELKASDVSWVEKVQDSRVFGWALEIRSLDTFKENINLVKELGHIMVNFFNSRRSLSTLDQDYFESDHAQLVLTSIEKILITDHEQELIKQSYSEDLLAIIEVYGWDNRFNQILLKWIFSHRSQVKDWV